MYLITGATGFLGQHLLAHLAALPASERPPLALLVRRKEAGEALRAAQPNLAITLLIGSLEAPAETDENGVADPATRRARLRAKAREFYYHGAVDKPSAADVDHAEEHLGDHDGHPVELGENFQGVSETGIPKSH